MLKFTRPSFSRSLRLGAVLLTLASLGACAAPQRGFASTSAASSAGWGFATLSESSRPTVRGYAPMAEPAPSAGWGFATLNESSTPTVRGYAPMAEPASSEAWGYARLPARSDAAVQASHASAPTSAQR